MDYFSHGFWSYIFFHRIKTPLLAVAFGLLPDTVSWGVYAAYRLMTGGTFGKPILSQIPHWIFTLYDISHSLIVATAAIALASLITRKIPLFMLAWPIAIVMDLFTHSRDFLPTPFLWPLSDWKFPGFSWASGWFIALNYLAIAIALIAIYGYRWRRRIT